MVPEKSKKPRKIGKYDHLPISIRRVFERRDRKIDRYSKNGQLRDGVYYCKTGKPITDSRINQYEPMWNLMINKFAPARAIYEKGFDYEDLVNQCKQEVFLALLNGFDPEKALSSKDPKKEEAKRKNPEEALRKLEPQIVYGRLERYFRRELWKYHPDQYGGSTVGLLDSQSFRHIEPQENLQSDEDRDGLLSLVDKMNDILSLEGSSAAMVFFNDLKDDIRDSLREYLGQFLISYNKWKGVPGRLHSSGVWKEMEA